MIPSMIGTSLNSNGDVEGIFSDGQRGAWYDPSDTSTLFQDYQGNVPVIAVDDPVSLILDKSKGLQVGPELASGAGTLSDWTGVYNAVPTDVTSGVLTWSNVAPGHAGVRNLSNTNIISGVVYYNWYTVSAEIKQLSGTTGNDMYISVYSSGVTSIGNTNTVVSDGSWQPVSVIVNTNGDSSFLLYHYSDTIDASEFQIRSISVTKLEGNHCQQFDPTKAPLFKQDGGSNSYLLFDGIDDYLECRFANIINTDKVTNAVILSVGIQNDEDDAERVVAEWQGDPDSISNSFSLTAPSTAAEDVEFKSRGSGSVSTTNSSLTKSTLSTVTAISSIPDQYTKIRIDGTQESVDSSSQGATYFTTLTSFTLASRAGTSLFFSGRIYQLIMKLGGPNQEQVMTIENYINSRIT